ncbi:hypothetical protein KEM60_01896 [Austwickia sp. TVS 96-490-7B]|uniref:DMT family transporter n=1 Tax=Austwickia sp. TVS 96-490-7B TaxID=2830843 RepID=UPI001D237EB7|nr:DMT family transporter [Austwickia sp. TVS 96-490-7B]MBW3085691.1 hypothetical protein [Austwickia sp. TVS 96-490-7B]
MSSTVTPAPTSADSTYVMNKKLGLLAMVLSATGMGFVGTFGRLATPVNPATGAKYIIGDFLALGRMATGALGMLLIIIAIKKMQSLRTTKLSFTVIAGGVSIGAALGLYVSATLMTSIANAVFLIYTGPLFSALLAWIFLKERITARHAAFLVMVFIGMLMTIGVIDYVSGQGVHFGLQLGADPAFPQKALGDMFGLASGFFYGLSLFFYRYRGDVDSQVRAFWNFIFGAVGALGVMVFRMATLDPTNPITVMSPTHWAWAAGMFLFCGFFAIGFLVVAGKHLLAIELSCVSYWECVVALLLGALVWGESLTLVGAVGGLLIIVGGMGPALGIFTARGDSAPETSVTAKSAP